MCYSNTTIEAFLHGSVQFFKKYFIFMVKNIKYFFEIIMFTFEIL